MARPEDIPGTYIFDGELALKGYPLNRMCYSFNEAANRKAFLDDEEAYCARFGLSDEQRDAIRRRDVLALLVVQTEARAIRLFVVEERLAIRGLVERIAHLVERVAL